MKTFSLKRIDRSLARSIKESGIWPCIFEIGLPHGILALAFESRIGIPSIERYRMELVNVYAERRQVYLTFDIKL